MHIIYSADAIASVRSQISDPALITLLDKYAAALEEFGDDLDATIIIAEAGDTLAFIEQAYGARLVAEGQFTFPVETIARQGAWFDVLWIQSDDGSGFVLLAEFGPDTDAQLLSACEAALDHDSP